MVMSDNDNYSDTNFAPSASSSSNLPIDEEEVNDGRRIEVVGQSLSTSLYGNGIGDHGRWSGSNCSRTQCTHIFNPTHSGKKSTMISGWRRKLNACRHPSTESLADIPETGPFSSCVCTGFRRSSSDTLVENNNNAPSSPMNQEIPLFTLAVPHSMTFCPPSSDPPYSRNGRSGTSASRRLSDRQVRSMRNSPFCPCFSPTDSDEEEPEPQSSRQTNNNTQVVQRVPALTSASRQIISIAREFRSRLAIAADATAQPAGPIHIRRAVNDGILMAEQPYPVHTTVEYTHYLVPDLLEITMAPYYWGVMDRFEAEKQLDGKPEGTFLLRDSAQNDYLFSVSFRRYQRTLHARIEQSNHRFSFDSYDPGVFSAETVTQLIENYKDPARCLFFEPQLTHPLNRSFVFPLQHICRSAICTKLSYNDIKDLPIPRKFKEYLREYHYRQPIRVTNLERTT